MVHLLITTAGHASRANLFSMSYTTAYLLCIAAFIFAVVCSINVKSTFNKYDRIASRRGVTAAQAARQILDRNGLYYVQVQRIAGNLTDNYNPKTNIVSLSDSVYDSTSLAAIGVAAFGHSGYNVVILRDCSKAVVDEGLKYVNNDACYPSILIVGQLIHALNSGKYDLRNTSVMITQTGGACRATNYVGMLKKALKDSGHGDIPLISLNVVGLEKQSGFKLTMPLALRAFMAIIYGDVLSRCLYKVRPYEVTKGSADALYEKWRLFLREDMKSISLPNFNKNVRNIVKDFSEFPVLDIKKPRVGLVGEILVKFHPVANNNIIGLLENEGCEVVVPDLMGFFYYICSHGKTKRELLYTTRTKAFAEDAAVKAFRFMERSYRKAVKGTKFGCPGDIYEMRESVRSIVSPGNIAGEGWFLSAEMLELIGEGVPNIVCMQPFACLPNHVTGKGVIGELRRQHPESNIVAVDFDPGASEVNQVNRIKLMLTQAYANAGISRRDVVKVQTDDKYSQLISSGTSV